MSDVDALFELYFPSEFVVEYRDGKRETLLCGDGVGFVPASDDPEGVGFITANLKMKHSRNQKHCGRLIRFTDLQAIYSVDQKRLWPPETKP